MDTSLAENLLCLHVYLLAAGHLLTMRAASHWLAMRATCHARSLRPGGMGP